MAIPTRRSVEMVLEQWSEPHLKQNLIAAKAVRDIQCEEDRIKVQLSLGFPADAYGAELSAMLQQLLREQLQVSRVEIDLGWDVRSHAVAGTVKPLPGIKNIIAVASGKGGVGKSTTTANLALALAAEGARVGILDADVYGPSQPRMLGIDQQPDVLENKRLKPLENHGVQVMSVGFLVDEEAPVIWRGPMVTQALTQLLNGTAWQGLDYLLVDLPPGTGDVQLTMAQKVPVTGAVIVTTPQDIALLDARKGVRMFEKANVPVLGVVENMSTHICSGCGREEHIFGAGGGARMAANYELDLLGELPLDIRIREGADAGKPIVLTDPAGTLAQAYGRIARNITAKIGLTPIDFSASFPRIVVHEV
ncbi:iron-sulfur cluster carrier protein ApbC [Hydrocarboniclastica marina]|uniref:Iron-sulfur cluster carrier protein n=1 Tax=Hydrocarboniclastica marina TaxID=2259620 RepID=A0A4P7XG86_9ALTE|nr:iron-sulfur cluster carrier protein ApbC [Hydrocarboniclastica marina]MAL99219.1 iron-sulfur cluster carrier protein ApbC [Alteromonadaceae bacterium]QCF25966.1 iron-sulfur cluster carrier protein ApbC [Hydrocarboniclastica marina]|tara:strand:+ start:1478 stop:2569 length:1092 start_codon:yes stop_codon:yes gene_type:complete